MSLRYEKSFRVLIVTVREERYKSFIGDLTVSLGLVNGTFDQYVIYCD